MSTTDPNLLAQISEDYYLNKLSFGEISTKYDVSRYLINKYLTEAVKTGVVKIEIATSANRNSQLEQVFKEKFPNTNCYIIQDDTTTSATEDLISNYAANLVVKHLENGPHIVGMTWGDTMYSLIDAITSNPLDQIKFTQFVGENMKYNSTAGSVRIVERAAKKVAGEFLTLPAPLYLADDAVRNGLYEAVSIKQTIDLAKQMDTVLTGMGTIASLESIAIWNQNINRLFPNVKLGEVAGMIYGRPYDINGNILNVGSDKVVGLDMNSILATPKRIGVVRSKAKSKAALGALRGGFVTDLVMSESLAYRIINEEAE
ncbi:MULTISPECIES: sugar-binding transcriptional regulator [Fructobacillus]|uniref:DeoR family (DeoR) n=1 Tax=Fructobacillus tropaeoli TaxID=709323 RepID=A0ABM9MMX2_9LACO|nr:sugar-binding domain-containing protein [Fructobacillus tropaeoli]CAK1223830.1 DNA-binding transcriptional regulator LsrR [Fructobacillus cardui]CAK1226162.1 DNA-binding transcriptional regulator LsrR [Fructobacillus tropaeoli]CAK1227631.1 DNA-binding transcriptional regulator LsrR [Fructobacillus tropaeoli]CAK1232787.1 DNA-binding transcriptional regulator LsrR [Fructobacillus tropaeoli]CAK1235814.1 DNA-binding transcriptional regulator LsrR [Fructobacillus tropaeoli]